ncbi:MAG TPA: agmatine deiminase family protein [Candidatus Aquilonibacter sp.]|jgi:agmatine deiminase|nr:agmatine deiminase family protein [Candidatus Aquilonibacter sp.]
MPCSISSQSISDAEPVTFSYRMPAEWEPHAATWLAWPHYHGDWPGKFEPVPWVCTEIIRNLARHERVELIVNDAAAERQVRKILARANALSSNVRFHRWPTNRIWLRDSGCIFVAPADPGFARPDSREPALSLRNGRLPPHKNREGHEFTDTNEGLKEDPALACGGHAFAINFRFNAWAKYSNWRFDDKIGGLMSEVTKTKEIRPAQNNTRVVLEGGSIDVNGCGTILTTEECLLSKVQQRNPGLSRRDYEKIFADYLGASHTIWLGKGISGDDTHGHVDDLTRFVAVDTVVTVVENNPKDVNHKPLRENLRRLKSARDQDGKRLNVVEIPLPAPVIFEKRRLPASYANFYIANGVVLVPVFNDPNDRIALNTLTELFPTREIVPIYSGDLVWGLGTMHCMTQQQPSV